ncbi:MFS transporter [Thermodesulfobacteriota bacterium]
MTIESKPRRLLQIPPALYYPSFRKFWFGMFGAVGGFQILMFGQYWLVHDLTGSPLYLGYVGAANAIPAILLNLLGGAIADKADRRYLIVVTETLSASLVLLLGILTLTGAVRFWHVLVIAVFAGAINAFNQPARMALYPSLIDRKALLSAVALSSAVWQASRIIAPAIAGVIIAFLGTAAAFFFACAGMLTFSFVVFRLKVPKNDNQKTPKHGSDILDGLKFIKENSIFSFLIAMTFFNSFFGMAYIPQMPVFSRDILDVGASGQGLMLSVSGIGALIATFFLSSAENFRRKGLVLIGGAVLTGLSVAAFALSAQFIGSFVLACICMFSIGVCTSIYMILIINSLQTMVPDNMRGRVMGFYGMTWNIMPLGGMYAGALAGLIGAPFAIALGGLLVSLFALGPALLNKRVRNIGTIISEAEKESLNQMSDSTF